MRVVRSLAEDLVASVGGQRVGGGSASVLHRAGKTTRSRAVAGLVALFLVALLPGSLAHADDEIPDVGVGAGTLYFGSQAGRCSTSGGTNPSGDGFSVRDYEEHRSFALSSGFNNFSHGQIGQLWLCGTMSASCGDFHSLRGIGNFETLSLVDDVDRQYTLTDMAWDKPAELPSGAYVMRIVGRYEEFFPNLSSTSVGTGTVVVDLTASADGWAPSPTYCMDLPWDDDIEVDWRHAAVHYTVQMIAD